MNQRAPRSWLFLDGTSANKLAKAPRVGADALVVDLASISAEESADALASLTDWLVAHRAPKESDAPFERWVRTKSVDRSLWRDELAEVMRGAPDGVILPRADSPDAVRMLASEIYEMEARHGLTANVTRIIPEVGGTGRGALQIPQFLDDPHPRMAGFIWDESDLRASLGAAASREDDGTLTEPMRLVRSQTLFLGKALKLMAIEAPHPDAGDVKGGLRAALTARRDGFTGMATRHPRQIAPIHSAFAEGEA